MFNKIKNFITGETRRQRQKLFEEMQDSISQLKERNQQLIDQNKELTNFNETIGEQLKNIQQQLNKREEKYNGADPYIEIISDGFDPEKGIKINLDWNSAFIEHAKEHGLQGTTDYEIVRKYLAHMYLSMIEQMGDGETLS
jgi:predicted nuclease with TOPRIM domain